MVGNRPAPLWISWLLPFLGGTGKFQIAAAAGILTVLIAVVAGAAMYVGRYLTERLGQSIGNDLRVRLYHHLQGALTGLLRHQPRRRDLEHADG